MIALSDSPNFTGDRSWYNLNRKRRGEWVTKMLADVAEDANAPEFGGRIHPLQLAMDVQQAMGDEDWLVIDGGNTHFWSEIAVNLAGYQGKKLGGILHPGTFSLLGVGVSFAVSAKNIHRDKNVVLISGDGAFYRWPLDRAAFQENRPITVVIDNNGGLDCISQQQERLFESVPIMRLISVTSLFIQCLKGLVGMANSLRGGKILSPR